MTNNSPLLNDILNQPQSLAETLEYHVGVGQAVLHDAAQRLKGRVILFSGMGSSHFACYALSAELAAQGIASTAIDTAELLHYHYPAYRDAVAMLVSRSGESIEMIKVLPLLKSQGTFVIGVTDEADSTLAREADLTVLIHGGRDHLVAVQSYTATLISLHLLGAAMLDQFDQTHAELSSAIEALRTFIQEYVAASAGETWRSFFDSASVIHLLGRGRSIASIHEGALLFNEVARFPSVACEAAQFRH
ncbi:partial Arabinose 5-phosphate isomerase KpsF, partial [Gammaproteobacteria bacterium]